MKRTRSCRPNTSARWPAASRDSSARSTEVTSAACRAKFHSVSPDATSDFPGLALPRLEFGEPGEVGLDHVFAGFYFVKVFLCTYRFWRNDACCNRVLVTPLARSMSSKDGNLN